jgi:hypothetical protein
MPRNNSIKENIETDSWRTGGFSKQRLFNMKVSVAVNQR